MVVGKRYQLDLGPDRITGPDRSWGLPPDQDQAIELPREPGHEQRKGTLREDLVPHPVVGVIRINRQPHGGERR